MSKTTDPKQKSKLNREVEHQLLPRLKCMAYILLAFSLCAIALQIIHQAQEPSTYLSPEALEASAGLSLPDLDSEDLTEFNGYIAGFGFALVAGACLLYIWKQKKKLFAHDNQDNNSHGDH